MPHTNNLCYEFGPFQFDLSKRVLTRGSEIVSLTPKATEILVRLVSRTGHLVEKDELFRQADVLSIHLVLSERTRGLVTARELGLMKPTAYLINTSRGPIVDEAALVAALNCTRVGADPPTRAELDAALAAH